jgi:hypothetical protein
MSHRVFRGLRYVAIEPAQYCPTRSGESVDASAPIVGISLSYYEFGALETRDQPREIRVASHHSLSDFVAR